MHARPGDDRGIHYNSICVKREWTSTLTCTANNKQGVPYPWSGKEFKGDVISSKKADAEHSAARVFLADPDVQHTAANLDAPGAEARKRASKLRRMRAEAAKAVAVPKTHAVPPPHSMSL